MTDVNFDDLSEEEKKKRGYITEDFFLEKDKNEEDLVLSTPNKKIKLPAKMIIGSAILVVILLIIVGILFLIIPEEMSALLDKVMKFNEALK